MCFSTILSRVLDKYFVYMPPTPLSNGPSVNKVLLISSGVRRSGDTPFYHLCLKAIKNLNCLSNSFGGAYN